MPSAELMRLYQLHLVDSGLLEVRKTAANLDLGQVAAAEIEKLKKMAEASDYKRLSGELTDLELQVQSLQDKLKKFDKELYGGKIVNPREVEAYEKEIAMLKRQISDAETRELEIMEALDSAKEQFQKIEKAIEIKTREASIKRAAGLAKRAELEAKFASLNQQRPSKAEGISPALLGRYETIRKNHHGIGMARVTRENTCGECGTSLAEKTIQSLKDDRVNTCESCGRILYLNDGVM